MSEESNTFQPELVNQIDEAIEPLFAKYHRQKCYLGLIFQQGKRTMIQINVPAHDLPTLLQAQPSQGNDPDSGKNRPEIKGHAKEIKEYILDRVHKGKPWILGTFTANVAPEKIEIIELSRGICFVVIPRGVKLDITDGQHRKRAIHELIENPEGELIGDNDFPITLVLESNFNQCQTDFRDMAQTKQLDQTLLVSFGEFEGRVGITKNLIERVPMFSGKTEKIKLSPAKKLIYTTNYIAKLVSCAFADDPNDELKNYDFEASSDAFVSCLNQFFYECNQTRHIFETSSDELTLDEVNQFKENCILGRSVGIEVLGRLLYCTYDKNRNDFDREKVSKMAQLDWSRESQLWNGNIVLYSPNPTNSTKAYKITASANAVRIAISVAKTNLGWI